MSEPALCVCVPGFRNSLIKNALWRAEGCGPNWVYVLLLCVHIPQEHVTDMFHVSTSQDLLTGWLL